MNKVKLNPLLFTIFIPFYNAILNSSLKVRDTLQNDLHKPLLSEIFNFEVLFLNHSMILTYPAKEDNTSASIDIQILSKAFKLNDGDGT